MKKLTRNQFFVIAFTLMAIVIILFGFTWHMEFPGDSYVKTWRDNIESSFGAVHIIFNTIVISGWIGMIIWMIVSLLNEDNEDDFEWFYDDDSDNTYKTIAEEEKDKEHKPFKYKKWIVWLVILGIFYGCGIIFSDVYKQSVFIYNKSKKYQNEYIQKVQEKKGFYDKLWKTYLQKEKITNINKETFITVTKIIMENRADGEKVTWKWLQENQQIPYSEFTKFYADLSNFITSQREGYFNIERQCQEISKRNNIMLDTFPNNIYNRVLKIDKINFEYGFLSDSTNTIFDSKIENIK